MDDDLTQFTKNLNVSKKSVERNNALKAEQEPTPEGMEPGQFACVK